MARHQGRRATYRQLWEEVGRAARGLLARGVEKGDRLGLWAPNRMEWVVATCKIPAHWKLVDSFPMTVTGKVQKCRMREISVAELKL